MLLGSGKPPLKGRYPTPQHAQTLQTAPRSE